jgi:hypothetical protein
MVENQEQVPQAVDPQAVKVEQDPPQPADDESKVEQVDYMSYVKHKIQSGAHIGIVWGAVHAARDAKSEPDSTSRAFGAELSEDAEFRRWFQLFMTLSSDKLEEINKMILKMDF